MFTRFITNLFHRRPKLILFKVSDLIAGRDSCLTVRSVFSGWAQMEAAQGGVSLYRGPMPANGRVFITPITAARVDINLTLGPRAFSCDCVEPVQHSWSMMPRVIKPRLFLLWVWPWAWVGGEIVARWWVPEAEQADIEIESLASIERRPEAGSGAIVYRPRAPGGRLLLRIKASNSLASRIKTRIIRVRQRKPRIFVGNPKKSDRPGKVVVFTWSTRDTDKLWLQGEELPLRGAMEVEVTNYPQELVITAKGHGGTAVVKLEVHPSLSLAN